MLHKDLMRVGDRFFDLLSNGKTLGCGEASVSGYKDTERIQRWVMERNMHSSLRKR